MKQIRLGDYIEVLTDYHSGGSYKTLKEKTKILHKPSYAVMIRTLNFENDDFTDDLIYCDKESYDFLEYSHVFENDVLMNKIANPGSVYIMPKVDYRTTCAMNLFLLRFKGINQRYLYYVMKNSESYIKSQTHGTTTKTITKDEVRALTFLIHNTPEEQNDIEKILTNIDTLISNNKSICSDLEATTKLLYDYWFVQFDFPDENGNPYRSSGGKMVWNEELKREIPEGWKVKPLGDIINESKKSTVQVNDAYKNGQYPFFTSGNTVLTYNEFFVDDYHMFLNTGGNPDIKGYKGKCAYSTDTWCIDADCYSYIVYQYFIRIMSQFEQLFFAGSGLKHLQKDILKKQNIAIPPNAVVQSFNRIMEKMWDKKTECLIENKQLAEMKDFLLPMLMNGQVKVTNSDSSENRGF